MVFGIFRSIKKSSKLIKIYKILSEVSMDFDMDTMFKKSREKEKAIDYFDQNRVGPVLE